MNPPITELPIGLISISINNPRKHFDPEQLAELTESIRHHGILQPLLVRPVGSFADGGSPTYELVAGERRYRAAQTLGLQTVPVTVKELTEEEADQARLIENVQRADLNALEEAYGYKQLMENHGISIDDLCARTGKKRATVYARLALTRISPKLQTAMETGKLDASIATEIAKVPGKEAQDEALAHILKPNRWSEESLSFRQAKKYLAETFLLDLTKAPFDTRNGALTQAGSCESCIHRSGNCRDLYPDIKSREICTNRACYQDKLRVHGLNECCKAEAAGLRVLRGKKAKEAINYDGGSLYGGGYVKAEDVCYDASNPAAWGKLLKGSDVKPVLVMHPESHVVVEAFVAEEAMQAAKAAGKIRVEKNRSITPEDRKALILENKIERRTNELVAEQVIVAMDTLPESVFWAAILGSMAGYSQQKAMSDTAQVDQMADKADIVKQLASLTLPQLRAKAFRAIAFSHSDGWQRWNLQPLTRAFTIDWKAAEKQAAIDVKSGTKATKAEAPQTAEAKLEKPAAKAKKGGRK